MEANQSFSLPLKGVSPETPLVGRGPELGILGASLRSVAHNGGCLLVEGPPGIGKSALVDEALRFVGADVLVLRGSADEFCVKLPFQLVAEALRTLGPGPLTGMEGGSLWGAGAQDPLTAGVQEAVARVERACAARPVVLVARDLQWADEASLTVLGSLMRLTGQLPLLLVGELTTGARRDEVRRLRRAVRARDGKVVELGPLEPEETVLLAERTLGLPVSPDLRRLLAVTGGNPLYVRELLAAMTRERQLVIHEGHARLTAAPESCARKQLPASLGAAISDRLGYMSNDTLEALRAASLLGVAFDPRELSAVLDWPLERVTHALGEAVATGVLSDRRSAAEFHAPLLRQALYESIPAPVRALRHQRTAQVLDDMGRPAEHVAAQLVQAGGVPDTWTLNWLAASGTTLLYRVPHLAMELLEEVVAPLDRGDERREPLEAVLAMAMFLRGKLQECREVASRVLERTEDPERAAEMAWILSYALLYLGHQSEAVDAVTSVPRHWSLSPVWEARLSALYGVILNVAPDRQDDEALLPLLRRTLDVGRALGDAQTIAYTANALYVRLIRDHAYEEAGRCLEEGLAASASNRQLTDIHLILLGNGLYHWHSFDQVERARNSARRARRLALETGTAHLASVLVMTAISAYTEGSWDEALADLRTAGEPPFRCIAVLAHSLEALIRLHRGEADVARKCLKEIGEEMSSHPWIASGNQWRARLMLAEAGTDHEGALSLVRRILAEDFCARVEDAHRFLVPAVRTALRLGEQELAAALAATADGAVDDRPLVRAVALQCRGLTAADPEPLREALAYFRETSRAVEAAECAEDLAVVLALTGDTDAAKAAMREAADGYCALGAVGDLDRADARWREAGLRRGARGSRRRPASGWESLTPTERRVAELVAEGLSNPDIGERLYSSRRTVQTHVTHILAKLGLRSRGEVARTLARRSPPRDEELRTMAGANELVHDWWECPIDGGSDDQGVA